MFSIKCLIAEHLVKLISKHASEIELIRSLVFIHNKLHFFNSFRDADVMREKQRKAEERKAMEAAGQTPPDDQQQQKKKK